MKKLIRVLVMAIVVFAGSFGRAAAANGVPSNPEKQAAVYAHIVTRINEIQAMDKENLSVSEKKALRKELFKMKKQASGLDKGVYLSVGAIIIIVLLLILILR